jgi:SM-20-related protein
MKQIKEQLREDIHLPLQEMEMQIAHYKPGSFYHKHADQSPNQQSGNSNNFLFQLSSSRRLLTAIYYVNPNYKKENEGCLRLYHKDGFTDIEPVGDRFVLFRSELEHEVLPTKASRFAITTWFKT